MAPKKQPTRATTRVAPRASPLLTQDAGVKKPAAEAKPPTKSTTTRDTKPAPKVKAPAKAKARAKAPSRSKKQTAKKGVEESEEEEENTPEPEKPKSNTGRKRTATSSVEAARPAKKAKARQATPAVTVTINSPPTERLDIYVFGAGGNGELGLDQAREVTKPRRNKLLDANTVGVVQIAVGGMHCVALTHDQKILTWGVNDNKALGRNTKGWEAPTRDADASDFDSEEADLNPIESTPTALPADSFGNAAGFAQVAATNSASFVLTTDGFVYGWGTFIGDEGPFGFFEEDTHFKDGLERGQARPVLVPGLKNIKSLSAGGDHMFAVDHKGNTWAWGCGEQFQLGHKVSDRRKADCLTPYQIHTKGNIASISSGAHNGFAIDNKGKVWAWGLNNMGQTGIASNAGGDDALIRTPTIVKSLEGYDIKSVVSGNLHSIACTKDYKTLVWGKCEDYQPGIDLATVPEDDLLLGELIKKPRILVKPTLVPGVESVFVAAGIDNCMAITKDGKAYSWGYGESYRCGQGTDDSTKIATWMNFPSVAGKKLTFAGCGGQFGVVAGPAVAVPTPPASN